MNKLVVFLRYILFTFFLSWALVWISIRAYKISENKDKNLNIINSFLVDLYETPYEIKRYFKKPDLGVQLNNSDSLLSMKLLKDSNSFSDSLFILHSKFVNQQTSKVLLQNITSGEIAFSWDIPIDVIMKDLDSIRKDFKTLSSLANGPKNLNALIVNSPRNIIVRHPVFLRDSSLIFKVQYLGHIYKIDKNSKLLWKSKKLAHHSIELDENGNIWTCSVDLNHKFANELQYREDAILCLDQSGNEKYFISLTDIFNNNGLFDKYIQATPVERNEAGIDPYHLNDVQPVTQNGTYWKKGDLFLSLRHKSLLLLFRPSSNAVLWIKQGPWFQQHDVNIENDSIISIFNNNTSFINDEVNSSSNLSFYNFKNSDVRFTANGIFRTPSEGRQTSLSTGDILIESTNESAYFLLDTNYNLKKKFFVPYELDSSLAQYPGWSRFYLATSDGFIEE